MLCLECSVIPNKIERKIEINNESTEARNSKIHLHAFHIFLFNTLIGLFNWQF